MKPYLFRGRGTDQWHRYQSWCKLGYPWTPSSLHPSEARVTCASTLQQTPFVHPAFKRQDQQYKTMIKVLEIDNLILKTYLANVSTGCSWFIIVLCLLQQLRNQSLYICINNIPHSFSRKNLLNTTHVSYDKHFYGGLLLHHRTLAQAGNHIQCSVPTFKRSPCVY